MTDGIPPATSPRAGKRFPHEQAGPGHARPGRAGPESAGPEHIENGEAAAARPVPLLEPRDGLPPMVTTARALAEAVAALGAGEGPLAVDAERASGYRYGHRAFLVQLRRRGAGTVRHARKASAAARTT